MASERALGHLGLMFGVLGVILAVSPPFGPFLGIIPWLIGVTLVAGEYFGPPWTK